MSKPIQPVYRMLGIKMEQVRTTLGMTQAELGEKCGLGRTSIVNIEKGRQRILLHDIEAIAAALHVSPKHLLRGIWT